MRILNFVIWTALAVGVAVVTVPAHSAEPAKQPATQKKEVKKHKKVEGTKVPEKAPATAKKPVNK
jgi:hypothetical protein